MSILTKIFSSGASDLIGSIGGVVDNLTTSKEEKLESTRRERKTTKNQNNEYID